MYGSLDCTEFIFTLQYYYVCTITAIVLVLVGGLVAMIDSGSSNNNE